MDTPGVISEIALLFATGDDFDNQLYQAMAIIGEKFGVTRCALFLDDEGGQTTTCAYEWCAPGVEPGKQWFQQFPYASFPSWKEILQSRDLCVANDVRSLPKDVRASLKPLGSRSIIVAPLQVGDSVRGYIGCEDCRAARDWSDLEKETVQVLESMIATTWAKRQLTEKLSVSEENFKNFFNTIEDILLVSDLQGTILFGNRGACRKLGYQFDELIGKQVLDIHPPEMRAEARQILEKMLKREVSFCSIDVWTSDEIRLPVETRVWFGHWNGQECVYGISKDLSAEQAALQKFERLFHGNPTAMAVSSAELRCFVEVNEAMIEKFGYSRDELIGSSSIDLGLFADPQIPFQVEGELLAAGRLRNRDVVMRRKDGKLVHGLLSGDIITILGRQYILTVMIDITSQVELGEELTAERERLFNIIEGTRLGTWEWHIPSGKTVFNRRWAKMLGYTLEELQPTTVDTWKQLSYPDDFKEVRRLINLHFEGITDFYECERRLQHKDGSWVWILDRGKVIERDDDGRPVTMYGTHTDVTDKKNLEEQIRELAIRDPLTQAYNRRYISDRLEEIVAEHARGKRIFCVSMIDIDHFKAVNDTYGHQAGDYILTEFARIIGATIRQYDLFGRYGGEEFIIVSPGSGARETIRLIERVMNVVRKRTFTFEGHAIQITFSCGLADSTDFPGRAFALEKIIALADKRLYAAKEAGRNRCFGP